MSETVVEFMQKSAKKYPCGRLAHDARKKLVKAFTSKDEHRQVQDSAMFEAIIDDVMKTKKGRETMVALSKLGYSFAFERAVQKGKGKFGGFCDPEQKKIVINPDSDYEYMLRVAVHEGRHAIQYSLDNPKAPGYQEMQVASALRKRRAIEADAVAHEMAFVYECKDILPDVYQKTKEKNLPMLAAFEKEMENSGNERKAMQAAFAAWYECDSYRTFYDQEHKKDVAGLCGMVKRNGKTDAFSQEYPVEDVVKMCCYKGQPYMTAKFLNTGLAFSIPPEDKAEISAIMQDYAAAVPGAEADASVMTMHDRKPVVSPAPVKRKNQAKAAAIAATLGHKGR